jgi:hypothetical protein
MRDGGRLDMAHVRAAEEASVEHAHNDTRPRTRAIEQSGDKDRGFSRSCGGSPGRTLARSGTTEEVENARMRARPRPET